MTQSEQRTCSSDSARSVLRQVPGLVLVDLPVDQVGDPHDLAQGLAVLAVLVSFPDRLLGVVGDHRVTSGVARSDRGFLGQDPAVEVLVQDRRVAADDVHVLADQVAVHPRDEVIQVEVDVLHRRPELGGVVIAQPLGVEAQPQVALRGDERAAALGHLLAVNGEEAVGEDLGRGAVAGVLQHGGPEQGVEVEDVLADEMHQLGVAARAQEGVLLDCGACGLAPGDVIGEAAEVADRRVEPDVEELLALGAGNREAEVGRIARDVPIGEPVFTLLAEPLLHLVGGLGLQPLAALGEAAQERLAARVREAKEVVLGGAPLGLGAGDHRVGVVQLGGGVGGAADFARVAVLVLGAALGAFALDVAVRQEHLLDRIVELLDRAHGDEVARLELQVDVFTEGPVLGRIRRMVVVEADQETVEVALVLVPDPLDQLARADPFGVGAQHDRRAVGIVRADVVDFIAAHLLEPDPDVGLDVLDQVAEVDRAVGIGQGRGDEDPAAGHRWGLKRSGRF